MAARAVIKLLTKTCTCSFNSSFSSSHFPGPTKDKYCKSHVQRSRSYSQPSRIKHKHSGKTFIPIRSISKSLEHLSGSKYRYDLTDEELPPLRRPNYQTQTARLIEKEEEEEEQEEQAEIGAVYQVVDRTVGKPYFDVIQYMKRSDTNMPERSLPHLQPRSLRPFGSNETMMLSQLSNTKPCIIYTTPGIPPPKRMDEANYKQFSLYRKKEYPGYELPQSATIGENKSGSADVNRQSYSTSCQDDLKIIHVNKRNSKHRLPLTARSFKRKASIAHPRHKNAITKTKEDASSKTNVRQYYQSGTDLIKIESKHSTMKEKFLSKSKRHLDNLTDRQYTTTTCEKKPQETDKYVTVKLGDLIDDCRKAKECKPKKISFGRLPKHKPPDCPCLEDFPLKEGDPIIRLKKRSEPKAPLYDNCPKPTCTIPRADENLRVKRKTLPQIKVGDCPCTEQVLTDFKIKRLPKVHIDQKLVCKPCDYPECCVIPRADAGLEVEMKTLPKLCINTCPCFEAPPLVDVPLNPIKGKKLNLDRVDCKPVVLCPPRADRNLRIKRKSLPVMEPTCHCVEPTPILDVPPLVRLGKFTIPDKPWVCPKESCADMCRADDDQKVEKKKLPVFKSMECPCIEAEVPSQMVPMKRLKKVVYEEKDKSCPVIICGDPRADDNLRIKRKTLPKIVPGDCPCTEVVMTDPPPLRRLKPLEIREPPRICPECPPAGCCPPRSDAGLTVEPRVLPPLCINKCPCFEAPPLVDVPLNPIKGKKLDLDRVDCVPVKICPPRADENLRIKRKLLPALKPTCICIEPEPLVEAPPLRRLGKFKIPDKPRCFPKDPCAEIVRADANKKFEKKKLPCLKVPDCPCIEPPIPGEMVPMKRLKKIKFEEKAKNCEVKLCTDPRADDNLRIKRKILPKMIAKECPCEEVILKDSPPLKRLVKTPVKEPPRDCKICPPEGCCPPRADAGMKIGPKMLPCVPKGSCPCVEQEPPVDVPPLSKLKKRPVKPPVVVCPVVTCPPRADENLRVKMKKLPKMPAPDCPCIEAKPPEDVKPLARLPKINIPDPPKCTETSFCDDATRADEDDWLYWKRAEVKPKDEAVEGKKSSDAKIEPIVNKTSTRKYSTHSGRSNRDVVSKYEVATLMKNQQKNASCSVVIDIKPAPPVFLNQSPIASISFRQKPSIPTMKAIDYIALIICKGNNSLNQPAALGRDNKTNFADVAALFNTINRFISTYTRLNKDTHEESHLQPKNPIIKTQETFIRPFPTEEIIDDAVFKSSRYNRTRKGDCESSSISQIEETLNDLEKMCKEDEKDSCNEQKKLTLWQKIVKYFQARPDCPSPEEFRKMRLREDAEKAASKAGLCLYDPKEMLRKTDKDLPKVITACSFKDPCKK